MSTCEAQRREMMRFVWRKFSCSKEVQEVIGEAEEQSVDKIIEGYIAT